MSHKTPLFEALTESYIEGDLVNEATMHGPDGKFASSGKATSVSANGQNYRLRKGQRRKVNRACGRDAREAGMNIRCYDGKNMERQGAKGILQRIADTVKRGAKKARKAMKR